MPINANTLTWNLNRLSGPTMGSVVGRNRTTLDASRPPPNVWGDKPFLMKLQVALGHTPPSNMVLYDRKRSFEVYLLSQDNPPLFAAFLNEMTGPRGGYEGLKMYRWARRTGDWQFSVCLDRTPPNDAKW